MKVDSVRFRFTPPAARVAGEPPLAPARGDTVTGDFNLALKHALSPAAPSPSSTLAPLSEEEKGYIAQLFGSPGAVYDARRNVTAPESTGSRLDIEV